MVVRAEKAAEENVHCRNNRSQHGTLNKPNDATRNIPFQRSLQQISDLY